MAGNEITLAEKQVESAQAAVPTDYGTLRGNHHGTAGPSWRPGRIDPGPSSARASADLPPAAGGPCAGGRRGADAQGSHRCLSSPGLPRAVLLRKDRSYLARTRSEDSFDGCRAGCDEPGWSLSPGLYPSVKWPVRRSRPALFVPKTSVVTTTERTFVIRSRSGKAEWVDVKKGSSDGDLIEVVGSLQPGDKVVRRATDELKEGSAL